MAVTMGDPSGVGGEIVLRGFAAGELDDPAIVFGDAGILEAGADRLGVSVPIRRTADYEFVAGYLNVVDLGTPGVDEWTPGRANAASGRAALRYVEDATRAALAGRVAGVVTLPMNKEATQLTVPGFVGHTEYIAALCDVPSVSMMLTTPDVAVTHVSTHVSLRDAIEAVSEERVERVIELTHHVLSRFITEPRIAVCGLNPHAGENGLFGDEEIRHIIPAIEAARERGWSVDGPFPADTVFYQAIERDRFDAVVAMYHDQGHAPMKLVGFETGVNVTVGLPIVRTSVDHGTAFDIAWQGVAFTHSLRAALDYAWRLVGVRSLAP